ncbi:hypothetical protein JCM10449v2_000983 [Rhodotorula kratochvilovae]
MRPRPSPLSTDHLPPRAASSSSSSRTSAAKPSLTLTVTVRHLPSDRWQTFTVPKEWRIGQLKHAALRTFGEPVEGGDALEAGGSSQEDKREAIKRDYDKTPRRSIAADGAKKENLATPRNVEGKARRSSDGGGLRSVGKVASSVAGKLRPFPLRSPKAPSFVPDSDIPPVPPLPYRDELLADSRSSTPPASSRSSLSLQRPLHPATPPRTPFAARQSAHHSPSQLHRAPTPIPSSSFVEHLDLKTPTGPTVERGALGLGRPQTPSQALWPDFANRRAEKGVGASVSKLKKVGRKAKASRQEEEKEEAPVWSSWCLVKAVTGGFSSDHRIVGSAFVDQNLLILKPRLLDYDPPLHLLHLPYLRLPSVEVLAPIVATTPLSTTPRRSKRRSWGASGGRDEVELVERALEVGVDDGTRADGAVWEGMAPIMVLRVFDSGALEQVFPLPATSIEHSSPEPRSPTSATFDKTPRQSPTPRIPLIRLGFDGGDGLTFRPKTLEDLQRILDLLDDENDMSDMLFEGEMELRKNIIDTAYRAHHDLPPPSRPISPLAPPPTPVVPLSPAYPVSRRRSLNSPAPPKMPALIKSATQTTLERVSSSSEEDPLERDVARETEKRGEVRVRPPDTDFVTAPSSPARSATLPVPLADLSHPDADDGSPPATPGHGPPARVPAAAPQSPAKRSLLPRLRRPSDPARLHGRDAQDGPVARDAEGRSAEARSARRPAAPLRIALPVRRAGRAER